MRSLICLMLAWHWTVLQTEQGSILPGGRSFVVEVRPAGGAQ